MSMGIGHSIWVEVIKFKIGDLSEVVKFINENPPANEKEWIDLQPAIHAKAGTCEEYCVSLVKKSKDMPNKRGQKDEG